MSAYDRWLASPYADEVDPPEPSDDQLEAAIDHVAERGGDILITDMQDEGFYLDNLRAVIVARTPAAQARACETFRQMFQLLHGKRIDAEAQRIADEEAQASRDAESEYRGDCARDAA